MVPLQNVEMEKIQNILDQFTIFNSKISRRMKSKVFFIVQFGRCFLSWHFVHT